MPVAGIQAGLQRAFPLGAEMTLRGGLSAGLSGHRTSRAFGPGPIGQPVRPGGTASSSVAWAAGAGLAHVGALGSGGGAGFPAIRSKRPMLLPVPASSASNSPPHHGPCPRVAHARDRRGLRGSPRGRTRRRRPGADRPRRPWAAMDRPGPGRPRPPAFPGSSSSRPWGRRRTRPVGQAPTGIPQNSWRWVSAPPVAARVA